MFRRLRGLLGSFVALGFVATSGLSQDVVGSRLFGTVTDPTGNAIAKATVQIYSSETGYRRSVETGPDGTYVAPQIPAGTYQIEASVPGFKTTVLRGVIVAVNENTRGDIQLQIGDVTTKVEVSSQASLVNTYTSALAQTINTRQVVDLPLNARDVTSLSMLVAGATDPVTTSFYASSTGFMQGTSPSVNGGRIQDNGYYLDGLTNVYAERFSANIYPNPDAIEEFTMNTGQYSAEFGGRPGGQLSARTKAGTNELHGSLFEFVRNDCCNARNFFDTRGKNDGIKRNQYGWAVGGPVYVPHVFDGRNKLFWFNSYQRIPFSQRGVPAFHRAWTAAEKNGDFSDRLTGKTTQVPSPACDGTKLTVDTGAIFDPRSANSACGSLGNPFAGNLIPASLLDPVAASFMKHTPSAAAPSSLIPYFIPQKTVQYEITQRVDLNLTSKHAVMARYMRAINGGSSYNDPNDLLFTSSVNALGAHAGANSIGFTETWTPAPNKVITAGFLYSDWPWYTVPQPNLFTLADFGSQLTTAPTCKQYQLNISGFGNIGGRQDKCGVRLDYLYQYTGSMRWTMGKHEIGFGLDYQRWGRPNITGFPNVFDNGAFSFNGGFTGLAEADFVIGRAVNWTINNPVTQSSDGVRPLWSAYVTDNIRVAHRLTLNLGLRWDPNTSPFFSGTLPTFSWFYAGRHSQVFPNAPPGILYTGDPGTPGNRHEWFNRYNQFAPRVGFAWDPTGAGKWALRGGFGSYFGMTQGGQDLNCHGCSNPPLGSSTISIINPRNLVNPWAAPPYNGTVGIPLPPPSSSSPVLTPFGSPENINPYTRSPVTYQWSLTVERSFGNDLLIRAGYVGARGTHLQGGNNYNLATFIPGASTTANIQQRRPDPNFTSFYVSDANGDSWYQAFQFTAEKRYSHGLSFIANYTFSKSIDTDSSDLGWTGASFAGTQDPRAPAYNKGLSDFDRTHVVSVAPIYDLPKLAGVNPVARAVLGNWTLSGILSLRSGHMYTPVDLGPGCLCGPTFGASRATLTGTPVTITSGRSERVHVGYFNQSAFAPAVLGTFGTAGRNIIRGPGFANLDLLLARQIPIREKMRFQFRFEAFNATNHVNLGDPDLNVLSPTFGRILSTYTDPRILQFGMKFVF